MEKKFITKSSIFKIMNTKRLFLLIISLLLCNMLFAQISKNEAFNIVKNNVLNNDYQSKNIFASQTLIPQLFTLNSLNNEVVSPDYYSWFFFIEDIPFSNWGRGRVVFINSTDGSVLTHSDLFPPSNVEMDIFFLVPVDTLSPTPRFIIDNSQEESFCFSNNNYAVIISGGGSLWSNWVRYWNDCAAIYSILVNKYHFDKSKIFVLMSNGTDPSHDRIHYDYTTDSSPLDLDGDGTDDIQFSATKSNITYIFDHLSSIMTSDDNLFIFTTDHGSTIYPGIATLVLWEEEMLATEFAFEVNKVNFAKSINVVMEQCYSGGFIPVLEGNNRVISTACNAYELSWAMPPDYYYNEYVFHWMSAVNGATPYGVPINADYDGNGIVTMDEAFQYASNADTRPETPQYSGGNVGDILSLYGLGFPYPAYNNYSTTGNLTISSNSMIKGTFIINNAHTVTINANVLS